LILIGVERLLPDFTIGGAIFAPAVAVVISTVVVWRLSFDWLTRQVGPRHRFLLVGTTPAAVALASELEERRQQLGIEIVGFVVPTLELGMPATHRDDSAGRFSVLGTVEDIPSIVRARAIDRVVVSLRDARGHLPMEKLLEMKTDGVTFDELTSVYEEFTGKIAVENLRPSWLVFSSGFRKIRRYRVAKKAIDIAVALVGLLTLWPLLLVIAVAVKLSSRGPIFYRQARVGRAGRVFTVTKFRSMRDDAEAATGPVWAQRNDTRITGVGRFLRRTRLDELPQLWNILGGDMSLVGPRPERPEFVRQLTRQIPFYEQRHLVRPGLTGWAQVCYTYGASVEDAMEKLQYDLFYIKNMSSGFDLMIMLASVKTVLLRRGA
jgi:sugar transferase (PEP-CTERM system associated)